MMKNYDVIIMGTGLAGSCLARQIRLEHSELSVLCLDKAKTINNWKVGEATVEMAADYFGIKLGLQNYLLRNQLLKNGLRFFFDLEDKSLKINEMSENGTTAFPAHCSYTFDRISLENDLVAMNRDMGVEVLLGAQVKDLQISENDENHEVTYQLQDASELATVGCRWLIDSTGRRQLLLKKTGQKITIDKRHKTSSTWGRFKGILDVDSLTDKEGWRERVNNTSRRSSVLHYMGVGYWIWIIQMPNSVFSIGVVYDNDLSKEQPKTQQQLRDFLLSHASLKEMMAASLTIDHMHFKQLAYHCDQYFSANRWGLTGESGAFSDPFYSPGSDFIGLANEFLVTLIGEDIAGKQDKLVKKVALYNQYYQDRYERVLKIYEENYKYFASYELMKKKYFIDLHNYYNIYYWPFLRNKHRETSWISRSNRRSEVAQEILNVQNKMLASYCEYLHDTGKYFSRNKGEWHNITAQSCRYNNLVKNDFSEQLSLKYLEETLGIAALSIMAEIHNLPKLAKLPKYIVDQMKLNTLLEWDVKDTSLLKAVYQGALLSLTRDLNDMYQAANISQIVPVVANEPLGNVKIEVAGSWSNEKELLATVANEKWQGLYHPDGNIYC